jgi:uncharacterized protein YdeI (YjbR/CyaY-like superfamily)
MSKASLAPPDAFPGDGLPEDVRLALAAEEAAERRFATLPPSHRKEHLRWIEEAKRPETRRRRLETTIQRLKSEFQA